MAPSFGHISAPPPDLGGMNYGAETCYLGAVGHGAEKKVQSRFYVAQEVNVFFFFTKKGQIAKDLGRCQYVILLGTGSV
jgi:hypothetical protein